MKTVTLDDEAYGLLKGAKTAPGESFSQVVKRLFGGHARLRESAGAWKDMTDRKVAALRRETVEAFGSTAR